MNDIHDENRLYQLAILTKKHALSHIILEKLAKFQVSYAALYGFNKYRLFNVLCWLWNIYEGAKLPSVYFITNTKHCITYLALNQLFPVLISHPEMYTVCSILLHFV